MRAGSNAPADPVCIAMIFWENCSNLFCILPSHSHHSVLLFSGLPPGTVLFASFLFQRLIGQLDGCSHKRTFRSCKIAETDLIYHAPLKIICFSDALILPQHKYRDLFPESVPRLIQSHLHLIRQQTSFKRHCPLEVRLILKAIYHTVAAAFPQCLKTALICQS